MESAVITSISDALELNKSRMKEGAQFIFRGLSCEFFALLPKIEWDKKVNKDDEQNNFENFKKCLEKQGYFEQQLIHNDFRALGLAKHYDRFPTRLLDWTSCILIALYFACENIKQHNLDGAVWCFSLPLNSNDSIWLNSREENEVSPFSFDKFKIFICSSFVDDFKMLLPKDNKQEAFGNSRDIKQQSIMRLAYSVIWKI
jgi:hypothetical protein